MDINSDNKNEGVIQETPIYNLYTKEEKIRKEFYDDLTVELVDDLLCRALASSASDIHLQPTQNNLRVRFRIDGVLYDQEEIGSYQQSLVLSRLKILSSLDIAKKRIPQDGKVRIKTLSGNIIDLRIATFPSIYGEKMVIRILDRIKNKIVLEELGFTIDIVNQIVALIKKPGFFLVTGPTGSGKTTSLYAILSKLNTLQNNIVTMEDPVEYTLDGITQSQVNPKAGFLFSNGLRALLRQDPDIIMIGEIRDKETAQIAIEAALTGHLVLSTLHTHDAASCITRLIDMSVEPFLINATLTGVLAQRLVRKLCSQCKYERALTENEKNLLDGHGIETLFVPKGCNFCLGLGYKGRTSLGELLISNDSISNLIVKGASLTEIRKTAINNGMLDLRAHALLQLKKGIISLDEFLVVN